MNKLKSTLLRMISTLSILLLFTSILVLIVFFVLKPEQFENTKKVLVFISESLGGGLGLIYIRKRIKAGIEKYGSLSKSFTTFLIDEPIIHSIIWIFIIFQAVAFSYLIPIYFLVVEVKDNGSSLVNKNVKVTVMPDNYFLSNPEIIDGALLYETKSTYTWGDSCRIFIKADGYEEQSAPVRWSGLAFFNIINGYKISPVTLAKDLKTFRIEVTPNQAKIKLTAPSIDTTFSREGIFKFEKNTEVKLLISCKNFNDFDESIIVMHDTTIKLNMKKLPGKLVLYAESQGGVKINDLDIYIDGKKTYNKIGETIILQPDINYIIRLIKERHDHYDFVPDFTVMLSPGQIKEMTFKTKVKSK